MSLQKRWVPKDTRVYDFSCCAACGSGYGARPGAAKTGHLCPLVTCLACETPQCSSLRDTCALCLVGLLDRSTRACGYKHCPNRAVAEAPRVGQVCFVCAAKCKRLVPSYAPTRPDTVLKLVRKNHEHSIIQRFELWDGRVRWYPNKPGNAIDIVENG